MIIIGIPINLIRINNKTLIPKKINLVRFPFQPKLLNFKANNGNSETSKKLNMIVVNPKKMGFMMNWL